MKRERKKRSSGFTLIEMLVVIVIIIALMGLVFKLTGRANMAANRASTVKTLERLRAAIEEFHTTYGTYPPCLGAGYEDFMKGGCSEGVLEEVREALKGTDSEQGTRRYGLVAYLKGTEEFEKSMGGDQGLEMTEADEEFVRRVAPYVKGLETGDIIARKTASGKAYTNIVYTYQDGWGNELIYNCRSPYVSYELFSVGEDGVPHTEDDIEGGMDL